MSTPKRRDIEAYNRVLAEIALRLRAADGYLAGAGTLFDLESAATQLRLVLELIVLGSLVTNRAAISRVSSVLKVKDAAEARRTVRSVNPNYWPRAMQHDEMIETGPDRQRVVLTRPSEDPVLMEADWGREFGFLSKLLHARLPHEPPRDSQAVAARLQDISGRIKALLRAHFILLLGAQDAIAGWFDLDKDIVQAAILQRLPEDV